MAVSDTTFNNKEWKLLKYELEMDRMVGIMGRTGSFHPIWCRLCRSNDHFRPLLGLFLVHFLSFLDWMNAHTYVATERIRVTIKRKVYTRPAEYSP